MESHAWMQAPGHQLGLFPSQQVCQHLDPVLLSSADPPFLFLLFLLCLFSVFHILMKINDTPEFHNRDVGQRENGLFLGIQIVECGEKEESRKK